MEPLKTSWMVLEGGSAGSKAVAVQATADITDLGAYLGLPKVVNANNERR